MGRKCSVMFCNSTSGLHRFPEDKDIRRLWFGALKLEEDSLPPPAGVCNRHFSRDCFSNYIEFEMGFTKQLQLKSTAVPSVAVRPGPPPLRPLAGPGTKRLEPKPRREMGCQTDPVLTRYAGVQADLKPTRRSKAIQAQAPSRSVSCDTGSFIELSFPRSSRSSGRQRLPNSEDVPPEAHEETNHIVDEERLLELFSTCPLCSRSCIVETTAAGTVLHVKQRCSSCHFTNEWSSQPPAKPAGDLQLCAAVFYTSSSFPQISGQEDT